MVILIFLSNCNEVDHILFADVRELLRLEPSNREAISLAKTLSSALEKQRGENVPIEDVVGRDR